MFCLNLQLVNLYSNRHAGISQADRLVGGLCELVALALWAREGQLEAVVRQEQQQDWADAPQPIEIRAPDTNWSPR